MSGASDILTRKERVPGRPFSDVEHTRADFERLRRMVHQLVDTYDDPIVCDFTPGKRPVCQSDPEGRHFRIYYVRPEILFSATNLTVVGFFGEKRPGAEIKPLLDADKRFESEFPKHRGLLSLSTVRITNGNFANLVLFTDPAAKDHWNNAPIHRDTVAKVSPPYYSTVRISNGILPSGLAAPDELVIETVKYFDYSTTPPWRAMRRLADI